MKWYVNQIYILELAMIGGVFSIVNVRMQKIQISNLMELQKNLVSNPFLNGTK